MYRSNTTFFNNRTDGRFGFTFDNQTSGGILGTIARSTPFEGSTIRLNIYKVTVFNRLNNYRNKEKYFASFYDAVKWIKHRSPQVARRLNHYK